MSHYMVPEGFTRNKDKKLIGMNKIKGLSTLVVNLQFKYTSILTTQKLSDFLVRIN